MNFTAKTYLFGPIADSSDGLIRKVQVDLYSSTDQATARREMRYTVTPVAKVDKNNDGNIDAADTPLLVPGDNFGFDEEWQFLGDGKTYSPTRKTDI